MESRRGRPDSARAERVDRECANAQHGLETLQRALLRKRGRAPCDWRFDTANNAGGRRPPQLCVVVKVTIDSGGCRQQRARAHCATSAAAARSQWWLVQADLAVALAHDAPYLRGGKAQEGRAQGRSWHASNDEACCARAQEGESEPTPSRRHLEDALIVMAVRVARRGSGLARLG